MNREEQLIVKLEGHIKECNQAAWYSELFHPTHEDLELRLKKVLHETRAAISALTAYRNQSTQAHLTAAKQQMVDEARRLVMFYMHRDGVGRSKLTQSQWEYLYVVKADGFGSIDEDFARGQDWDWSHVRDSSDDAMLAMSHTIRDWINTRKVNT